MGDFTNLKSFHIKKHPSIQQEKNPSVYDLYILVDLSFALRKKKEKPKQIYWDIVHMPNDLPI